MIRWLSVTQTLRAAKQWWIETFGCKVVKVPQDWDNPLPSDVALTLPGDSDPTILLSAQSEVFSTQKFPDVRKRL